MPIIFAVPPGSSPSTVISILASGVAGSMDRTPVGVSRDDPEEEVDAFWQDTHQKLKQQKRRVISRVMVHLVMLTKVQ